jgi:hypothetical protein
LPKPPINNFTARATASQPAGGFFLPFPRTTAQHRTSDTIICPYTPEISIILSAMHITLPMLLLPTRTYNHNASVVCYTPNSATATPLMGNYLPTPIIAQSCPF